MNTTVDYDELVKQLRPCEGGSCKICDQVCDSAADAIEQLRRQLPEGMQHCTIKFLECENGHGRLWATNWIDHGCHHCALESLEKQRGAWEQRAYGSEDELDTMTRWRDIATEKSDALAARVKAAESHLYAAKVQRSPSDDRIIADHIDAAYAALKESTP